MRHDVVADRIPLPAQMNIRARAIHRRLEPLRRSKDPLHRARILPVKRRKLRAIRRAPCNPCVPGLHLGLAAIEILSPHRVDRLRITDAGLKGKRIRPRFKSQPVIRRIRIPEETRLIQTDPLAPCRDGTILSHLPADIRPVKLHIFVARLAKTHERRHASVHRHLRSHFCLRRNTQTRIFVTRHVPGTMMDILLRISHALQKIEETQTVIPAPGNISLLLLQISYTHAKRRELAAILLGKFLGHSSVSIAELIFLRKKTSRDLCPLITSHISLPAEHPVRIPGNDPFLRQLRNSLIRPVIRRNVCEGVRSQRHRAHHRKRQKRRQPFPLHHTLRTISENPTDFPPYFSSIMQYPLNEQIQLLRKLKSFR
ncbi:unknown [Dialister sp. CAG:357]|nr:unknown [Dialister sp. CAG:357]